METLTAQEIFDRVVNGLRKQGRQCVDARTGNCVYRNASTSDNKPVKDGDRCAVGMLIEDNEYSPLMEGATINLLIKRPKQCGVPNSLVERLSPHINLIKKLQKIHDFYSFNVWEAEWKDVAITYSLIYTPRA